MHYGDDWGSQHGPLIAPDTWREFIKPRFKRMCDTAKECGLANSLHCCGNVTELMPDIIECGVDVFDPFQPEAMDIWELRKTYKGRIAFWGGLSVQQTLPHGTPDDIRRESRELLEKMGKDGGYVFSPSHALTGDIPAENIRTVIEIANNQEAIVPAR